jgi:hypothetical protein
MHYMLSFPSLSEVLLVLIYFMVHYSVVDEKTCHLDGDEMMRSNYNLRKLSNLGPMEVLNQLENKAILKDHKLKT